MAKITRKDNLQFETKGGNVRVTVEVGNGQFVNTFIKLGTKSVAFGPLINNLIVGSQADCKGKVLFVESNCTDVNSQTDSIPISVTISDDNQSVKVYDTFNGPASENTVGTNGGSLIYELFITIS
jgi:hypothetical protein